MNYQHNNNPGRLNKRITFYSPPGEIVNGWASADFDKYKSVWAEIKTQKGNRHFNSDATQWVGKRLVGLRYRSDIHSEMRIEISGVMYEIESLVDDDEHRQWLTIIAKEVL